MKKREREKDFRVKIISAVLLVLIILVFLIGFNWNKISGRVVGESSAASNIDKISLSVATLKDKYKVKEKILLTDPPDENIISGNVVSDGVLGSSFNNQIINNYDNILNSNQMIRKVIDRNGNIALENEEIKSKGYIIEFEDKPLVLKEKELAPAGVAEISSSAKIKLKTDINKERAKIRTKRETIKNNIKTKLGKSRIKSITGNAVANPEELGVLREYENVFNGIALDITSEEAGKIKTIPGVKSVSPNLEVKALLMDSVPLIGADQVWNLDEDGNDCSISGKECLTGKGVTIGIIDTGVDYTHEDLGNSSLGERKYEKISKDSLSVGGGIHGVNQFLSMDKNRVAYFSKDKLYIYDFNSKETLEIDAASTNSTPAGLVFLRDNYLVYSAEILSSPIEQRYQLYMYDLNKKNYKFIDYLTHRSGEDTFTSSGFAKIEGDKVVYTKVVNANLSTFLIFYNRFVYDILSDEKVDLNFSYGLIYSQYPFITKNNKVYYQIGVNVGDLKTNELIIYDLLNKTYQTIDLPGLEILTDVSEDEIIYSLENSRDYRVYNLQYNTYFDVNGSREITSNNQTLESASNLVQSVTFYFRDAKFGEDFIAYNLMSNFVFGHINIYDKALNKYIKLNLKEEVSYFDVEGNRICFTTILNEIKCHTYNITEDYSFFALPVFNNKVIGGWDFVNNDNNPMDDHGHGTHVAGIAAGDGAGGLRGVAPDAELYGYKVLSASGSGSFADVMTAIERAVDPNQDGDFSDHLDIISMSLGGNCKNYTKDCGPDDPVSKAIDNVVSAGVIAVIASGNSGPEGGTITSPGTARKAITIGATDKQDKIASFSSGGPVKWTDSQGNEQFLIKPDLVAPGVNICSAQWDSAWNDKKCLDNEHVAISGTSMATPMVAGAVALLKQKHPDWSWSSDDLEKLLTNISINLGYSKNVQGYGRINLTAAILLELRPQSKLTNVNSKPVTGTLRMYLQKKDKKGEWVNVKKAIDRKITIPGKGLVKLDNGKDRNGKQRFKGWNNLNVFAKAKGDYRVYTVLVVGNKKITGSWEFEVV